MASKYLKGGALNPAWCDEQDAAFLKESISESIGSLFSNMMMDIELELAEGVNINVSNKKLKNMCTVVNTENDYEAKFNFIKKHSATPEDLELAKEIVGLK